MKLFLSILLLSTTVIPAEWMTDFNKAEQVAAQNKKMILLNFSGSDWCGPCIRLKSEIFGSDVFNNYAAQHLVLVNADFPRLKKNQLDKIQIQQNEALAEKYNRDGKFPLTILLTAGGKVIKTWEGLPKESAGMFVEELKILNEGS